MHLCRQTERLSLQRKFLFSKKHSSTRMFFLKVMCNLWRRQSIAAALLCLACLDYYTPVLAVPLVMASSYISYASHWLSAHEGSWPTALLAAPLVWLAKSGVGILRETEKAVWGAQIFGMSPSKDLVFFIGRFNTWWTPFMGIILLTWGVGVRLYLVPKWPNDTERGEFSWYDCFYRLCLCKAAE